jgi:hypothetical protein
MLKVLPIQQAFNKAMAERHRAQAMEAQPQKPPAEPKKAVPTPANPNDKNKPAAPKPGETTAPSGLEGAPAGDPNGVTPATTSPSAGTLPEPVGNGGGVAPLPQPTPSPATSRSDLGARISEPAARLAAPTIDPNDEMVLVRICAESGKRATQWCSVTTEQRMRRRDRPGPCRRHKDPDG